MKVRISSVLHSYTNGASIIEIEKSTLNDVLDELDQLYPGIKFRFIDEQNQVRPHMKIFVNGEMITSIFLPLEKNSEIFITHTISGG